MSDSWGVGFDCPRCDRHYYANLPTDGRPVPFICVPTCGFDGTVELGEAEMVTFKNDQDTHKEATHEPS